MRLPPAVFPRIYKTKLLSLEELLIGGSAALAALSFLVNLVADGEAAPPFLSVAFHPSDVRVWI
jgi:hypothetical protein